MATIVWNAVPKPFLFLDNLLSFIRDELFIVYSDIRSANIVFNDKNSLLIDFDLAAKEDVEYLSNYNSSLPERHPSAAPFQPRKKEHDSHSLTEILVNSTLSLFPV